MILVSDLKFYLPNVNGEISSTLANDTLFPNITAQENVDGKVDYKCIFLKNTHSSLTFYNILLWFEAAQHCEVAIDSFSSGSSTEAPEELEYKIPRTKRDATLLGDLEAGQSKAIWIRRSITNAPAQVADNFVLKVSGATPP